MGELKVLSIVKCRLNKFLFIFIALFSLINCTSPIKFELIANDSTNMYFESDKINIVTDSKENLNKVSIKLNEEISKDFYFKNGNIKEIGEYSGYYRTGKWVEYDDHGFEIISSSDYIKIDTINYINSNVYYINGEIDKTKSHYVSCLYKNIVVDYRNKYLSGIFEYNYPNYIDSIVVKIASIENETNINQEKNIKYSLLDDRKIKIDSLLIYNNSTLKFYFFKKTMNEFDVGEIQYRILDNLKSTNKNFVPVLTCW